MKEAYVYRPLKFFLITYLITWVSWFLAAYFSYQQEGGSIYVVIMLPGLIAPFGTALWMILTSKNRELKKNFFNKLFNVRLIKPGSIPAILLIMPVTVLISILLSVLVGQPIDQLKFSKEFSFSVGFVPVLLVLFLAASFEELGWRSYAMDSLRSKYNYFTATLIFAALWAFWHFPLFFVNNYYHNELIKTSMIFAVNFMVSVFPMAFIISWLCHKNSGSILAAVLFHFIINISQEALQMEQITKCIETIVLIVIASFIVIINKRMFFDKQLEKEFNINEPVSQ